MTESAAFTGFALSLICCVCFTAELISALMSRATKEGGRQ